MITRRKIEGGLLGWQIALMSVAFVVFLAAMVVSIYWYLFGNNKFLKNAAVAPANPKDFVYQKHSLTNIMVEGIIKSK